MKCQSCGKKQATIKYSENIDGAKQELHLCVDCAKKFGITGFNELFVPMFVNLPEYDELLGLQCKNCGYRLEDYSRTGLFGCPECYNTFVDTLDELFYKIHGKNRHVKIEQNINDNNLNDKSKKDEILELREKLQHLVEEEKYEEAAVIRDKIKELERGN